MNIDRRNIKSNALLRDLKGQKTLSGFNLSRRQTQMGFNASRRQIQLGFTVIEMLVVSLLFVVILGVGTTVMISTASSSNKAETVNKAKQNGSRALDIMEKEIRGAQNIIFPAGGVSGDRLDILNASGAYIRYRLEPNAPAAGVNQAVIREEFTDATYVTETAASNLIMTDNSNEGITVTGLTFQVDLSQKNVKINFSINRTNNTLPGLVQFNVQNVRFDSSVSLRN